MSIRDSGEWTIATEENEKGNAGVLQLPATALAIIKQQPALKDNPYVFCCGSQPQAEVWGIFNFMEPGQARTRQAPPEDRRTVDHPRPAADCSLSNVAHWRARRYRRACARPQATRPSRPSMIGTPTRMRWARRCAGLRLRSIEFCTPTRRSSHCPHAPEPEPLSAIPFIGPTL